jgi:hypothetical protein
MIVVFHVGVISADQSLLPLLDARPFGVAVAEFMATRFDVAGYPVICVDRSQVQGVTPGITEVDKLYVSFRIDLSSARVANDPAVVVGTVSTHYRRQESGLLSGCR